MTNTAIRPVAAEQINPEPECSVVYLPDVSLQVVEADGRSVAETVDRAVQVCQDAEGRWKVRVPAEEETRARTP